MTSIVPQGKGQSKVIERTLIDDLNFTCILNSDVMSRWVTRYEDAKTKIGKQAFPLNVVIVNCFIIG